MSLVGGVLVMDDYEIEEIGIAKTRQPFDEDVVDCSNRLFEITTRLMGSQKEVSYTVFPSRRWRNLREGDVITGSPSDTEPLLYIGNPIRILVSPTNGVTVFRIPEFLIKSGIELGY
jgi:hypothetical protein